VLPFLTLFEMWGTIIEVVAYLFFLTGLIFGFVSTQFMVAFLVVSVGLGVFLSVGAFLLEELTFHLYPRLRHVLVLILLAVLENLGYRQLMLFFRFRGLIRWIRKSSQTWGEMRRSGAGVVPRTSTPV
jgi:hypothetical protein